MNALVRVSGLYSAIIVSLVEPCVLCPLPSLLFIVLWAANSPSYVVFASVLVEVHACIVLVFLDTSLHRDIVVYSRR